MNGSMAEPRAALDRGPFAEGDLHERCECERVANRAAYVSRLGEAEQSHESSTVVFSQSRPTAPGWLTRRRRASGGPRTEPPATCRPECCAIAPNLVDRLVQPLDIAPVEQRGLASEASRSDRPAWGSGRSKGLPAMRDEESTQCEVAEQIGCELIARRERGVVRDSENAVRAQFSGRRFHEVGRQRCRGFVWPRSAQPVHDHLGRQPRQRGSRLRRMRLRHTAMNTSASHSKSAGSRAAPVRSSASTRPGRPRSQLARGSPPRRARAVKVVGRAWRSSWVNGPTTCSAGATL